MAKLLAIITLFYLAQPTDKRIISIYTKNAKNTYYKQQLQLLQNQPGLAERDLVIKEYVYSPQTAALFAKQGIKNNFTVTLTGKDGGEKYRGTEPITPQELYGIIDVMPMRKDEMQKKNN